MRKTNEIKAIPELLDILCLKGCVVTIDAMGIQKEIAEKIIDKEADYILQVKGNQARFIEDIALYFEKDVFPCKKNGLAKEGRYYKDVCFGHGRQETREYYVENEIGWLKADHPEWKGMSGIGACVSTVTEKGVTTQSIFLTPSTAEAGWELRNMGSAKGHIGEWRTACIGCWT